MANRLLSFLAALAFLPAQAWAQQGQLSPGQMQAMNAQAAEMQATASFISFGMNVVFLAILGAVLYFNMKDMSGWRQPIKWVWFAFDGRLNRKAYWLKGFVPVMLLSTGLELVGLLFAMLVGSEMGMIVGGIGIMLVILPFIVFQFWVGLAIGIKRFHDLGQSGWWMLGMAIPFFNIWLMIKLAFFRGIEGPNAYGPDPLDPMYDDDELYGDEPADMDDDDGDMGGGAPQDTPPQPNDGGNGPTGGFGARKTPLPQSDQSKAPSPDEEAEPKVEIAKMSGGDASMDIIKRRLGEDITRPIPKRSRGGGEAEG